MRKWVLNELPKQQFEQAVIEHFGRLLARRRQAAPAEKGYLWVSTAELAVGVAESMGRTVPEIAVRSFVGSDVAWPQHPADVLFHEGDDGRFRINTGARWNGRQVSTLVT